MAFSFALKLSLGQEVISASGGSLESAEVHLDFTLGEIIVETYSNSEIVLTQGFHQSTIKLLSIEDFNPGLSVQVYPNPTASNLFVASDYFEGIEYSIYNESGQEVLFGKLSSNKEQILVNNLAAGIYTISLFNESGKVKSVKIIKIN